MGSSVGRGARNMWSRQPLAPPAEDVITGLEILVDLPKLALVKQDITKKTQTDLDLDLDLIYFHVV